jgi:hypothetical protein
MGDQAHFSKEVRSLVDGSSSYQVQVFMSAPNVFAISNLVRQMKGRSAEKVKGEFIDLRSRL